MDVKTMLLGVIEKLPVWLKSKIPLRCQVRRLVEKWYVEIIQDKEFEELLNEIIEFYNEKFNYKIDKEEVLCLCKVGKRLMADYWNFLKPESQEEIVKYYKTVPYSILELAYVSARRDRRRFEREILKICRGDILDYGGE